MDESAVLHPFQCFQQTDKLLKQFVVMRKLTSNVKPFGRVVVVTENVNTRRGEPIDEECAAGEDQGFVFF